ncbi:MAG: hypothetical protein IJP07_05395, partial [Firmicutes bacterium]|nr:hypothetical protein [Bacillota bacterium]
PSTFSSSCFPWSPSSLLPWWCISTFSKRLLFTKTGIKKEAIPIKGIASFAWLGVHQCTLSAVKEKAVSSGWQPGAAIEKIRPFLLRKALLYLAKTCFPPR